MKLSARMIASMAITASFTLTPSLQSQAPSNTPHPKHRHRATPKTELFLGYSYLRVVPSLNDSNRLVGLNGGNASIAFNFNSYLGLVADFGGYGDTRLRLAGPGEPAPTVVNSSGTAYTYLFGPRLSYRKYDRITPFAQALFGGVHASPVTLSDCTEANCTPLPVQNSFAMTAGAGVDFRVSHHISIRAIQAEYMMTRFAPLYAGASTMQNDLRLSSGLVFRFGGGTPPEQVINHAPVATCSTDGRRIASGSGEIVPVHVQASDPDNDPISYSWTTTNGEVQGSGSDVRWNSSGVPPGTYKINVSVSDGRGGVTDCSTVVLVEPQANRSPTMSCSADRTSAGVGDSVQVTASANDPDNDPLTYSWNSTGGHISGAGAAVTLDTSGLATNRYTITGQVNDGRGGTADCSVNVDVLAPTALELKLALHSIYFPTAEPTARNPNAGLLASQKQTLMELASDFAKYLESKPDAHLILEGHADPRGSNESNQILSERRVERTKQYLIERGVPQANIETKAFGVQQNLTDAQVNQAVEHSTELTPAARQKILDNMTTIILASNRRVDITLSTTGQRSIRQYPFNAADSLTLLRQEGTPKVEKHTGN